VLPRLWIGGGQQVSSAVSPVRRRLDPFVRQTRFLLGGMAARISMTRSSLEPRRLVRCVRTGFRSCHCPSTRERLPPA